MANLPFHVCCFKVDRVPGAAIRRKFRIWDRRCEGAFEIEGSGVMEQLGADALLARLRQVHAMNPELEAIAVVSVEGVNMASFVPNDLNDQRLSAMSAAMVGLGERIVMELGRGSLDHLMIKGDYGFVLMMSVNDDAVLTSVVTAEAKLGLLLLDMRRAASDLAKMI
ncbi:MAG: roadblock/LC7 domain-containing protein [Chloroflexi bacterium]|nr:roadblock/LC7 domain-containing protein [Chloroflexota bacterium]